jgi:hypothetical protein
LRFVRSKCLAFDFLEDEYSADPLTRWRRPEYDSPIERGSPRREGRGSSV